MFVSQHDKCVWQVPPPEETHDFGFHIAIWCLKIYKCPILLSNPTTQEQPTKRISQPPRQFKKAVELHEDPRIYKNIYILSKNLKLYSPHLWLS
jgi:hypothetical protein